ncbi:hypothetical protein OUZ56_017753 [Daphnia magna]|uniref:Uncharacterized protein n=1 Tax=Daphnia magna TaxID=35525 RepID=A0ABR0AU56_9CRUS|nr:hypothetical protein OUZ56_017753 [Daphnia magna]
MATCPTQYPPPSVDSKPSANDNNMNSHPNTVAGRSTEGFREPSGRRIIQNPTGAVCGLIIHGGWIIRVVTGLLWRVEQLRSFRTQWRMDHKGYRNSRRIDHTIAAYWLDWSQC